MKEGELRDYCRWNQIDNVRKILKNSYKEIDILHDEGIFFRLAISKSSTEMLEILLTYFEKLMKEKPQEYIPSKLRGVLKDIEDTCDISSEILEILKSREYLAPTEYSEGEQGRLVEIRGIKPKADLEEPEDSMLPLSPTTQKDSYVGSESPLGLESLYLAVRASNNYVAKQILDRTPEIVAMPDEYGQTALHLAADRGDEEIVRTILKVMKVEDIAKATKDWKYTVLHVVIRSNNDISKIAGIVTQILDKAPEIAAMSDKAGQTPLHLAASKGYEEVTKLLIMVMEPEDIAKAAECWHQYTALHMVVQIHSNNNILIRQINNIVKQILDKAPKTAGMQDEYGQTPLHWAAGRGDAQVVEYLINKMTKEDLLKKTNDGRIALFFAKSEEIRENMIRLLKDKGLNLRDEEDESDEEEDLDLSLDFTGSEKSAIIDKNGQTPLHLAIMKGSDEIARQILQKNPETASIRDKNGQTPLHLAIMEGSNEIAKQILELNPRIADIKDKLYGQTALHLAITIDNNEIVEQILSRSPYAAAIQDRYGQTALHLASGKPSDRIVKQILKEYPHIVGIQDREGFTALHRAAVNVNEDIVLALLEVMKSEDISKVTKSFHHTVLHTVIYSSNILMEIVKIAKHVLKKIPELAAIHDDKGNTALHAAISKGYKELIEQILELNSDLASMPNKAGQTALYLAASNENEWLCELLINKMSKTAILKELENGLENGLIELLSVKTPKREQIIKLLQGKSIDVTDKLVKTSKHVEIIDVGVTDHRVGEKRLGEHGFHQRKTLSDILKVISKIIAQYAQEELYQDEIAIFYKDSMGLNNKLLERQMKEVSNAIKFTAHLGTEQISGVDCGPFALENMRIMAKAITCSRENLFRAFDQFKEFCSLTKAKELRKGEFAEQYVLGIYQEMINEAIKAAKLHKIREQHFSEVEEIAEKLKKVEFFQDINIRPLIAKEYLGETINTIAVEIITDENTDPDRCDYSYGYRISFSRNLADRIKEIKKNIKLVFSAISDFGEETIIVSADEITSIKHKPKAAIRNYDVAPVKIEELFKNLNISDSFELQQEVQKILINKLLKNYISSFAVLDIIHEYLDVSPLLAQQIEIYKNPSIKQDIEIEQNAFNQKNNSHYYYKSSDIRMIQQEIMSPYLDSVIIYEPLGDKISVIPILKELIRSLGNDKATLCIYNLSNSHWIVFAALKTGNKIVIEELEQNASIIEVEKYAYEALSIFADQENVPVHLMGSEVIVEEVV